MSVHTASRASRVASFVGLGLASQASHVYLRVSTGVASRVYSAGLSNWRPAGRIRPADQVDPAREAKLDFYTVIHVLLKS